ncbi:Crp/Fnr family transcriptional regulator [Tenacibaculum mesophilum]|uniref:Crp/Fnr family transcriptional regulator n=1 Tax=Tenacibaculum mesophilum TaxID=104268 RepID=A0AAE9MQG6_9FLAO|nr:Crp/Fnr family transcriptional regulator [Tenacibaculum mesophilum]UTD16652.1 Crp/Fnr family transcriptional regulator [Tenacibaculum mesophilum]
MQDKYELLRRHFEEIVKVTDEEWNIIKPHFQFKKLKKYQFLIQTGQPVDCEFWIIKGLIKSYIIDEKGHEHILQFAMEEYWVSDYYAFQHKELATTIVDCIEDSEFFCLSFESREIICEKIPAIANFFRVKSNYGFINLQQRILSLLTQTAEERYDALLFKLPKLVQRVPKKLIAAYLGVSRETLSRFKG